MSANSFATGYALASPAGEARGDLLGGCPLEFSAPLRAAEIGLALPSRHCGAGWCGNGGGPGLRRKEVKHLDTAPSGLFPRPVLRIRRVRKDRCRESRWEVEMDERERWYEPGRQQKSSRCSWCGGSGSVGGDGAYVPGPNPFVGALRTMYSPRECQHCQGAGRYDSRLDPTLDSERDNQRE